MNDLTCIHTTDGLCGACQAEYNADPLAWLEYGDHPAGLARWAALQAEIAAGPTSAPGDNHEDVPF